MPEFKSDIEELRYEGISYFRYTRDRKGAARGSIGLKDGKTKQKIREIPTFPHIKRVYRLAAGIRYVFGSDPFFVEEKLDGYNVRIFKIGEKLLAATRGGMICPFTTEWVGIWNETYGIDRFFADHPERILCGEICGDNPYNSQRDPDLAPGAHLFVFDIMAPDGKNMSPLERCRLIEEYRLPTIPLLGKHSVREMEKLCDLLKDLNNRNKEGIVMKSGDGDTVVKFVTPAKDLEDIRDGLIIDFDLHQRYFRNRFLRIANFIQEFDLDREACARWIGRTFLDGYAPLESFEGSKEPYTVYVVERETWEKTRVLIKQVSMEEKSIDPVELDGRSMLRVRFNRVYDRSTHKFHNILKGFPHTD